ncbi:hypothetical protein GVN24_32885 [Rhizobium sp. CRIBSB]|nr:hypothetical protein [Rhizobium sp. CRIBSB]
MSLRRIALAFTAGLAFAAASAPVAAQTGDPLVAQTESIIGRFVGELRACGVEPRYVPGVIVDSAPSIVSFYEGDRAVHLSRWADAPSFVRELVTAWASAGTLGLTPEQQFAEIFNSLLVPHELGHFVELSTGAYDQQDFWVGEVNANRIALAYWALDPAERARLPERIENYNRFLAALPNPVPEGEDPHAYFQANYERLSNDPAAYGWYQGAFMRAAWAQKDDADFCTLVSAAAT